MYLMCFCWAQSHHLWRGFTCYCCHLITVRNAEIGIYFGNANSFVKVHYPDWYVSSFHFINPRLDKTNFFPFSNDAEKNWARQNTRSSIPCSCPTKGSILPQPSSQKFIFYAHEKLQSLRAHISSSALGLPGKIFHKPSQWQEIRFDTATPCCSCKPCIYEISQALCSYECNKIWNRGTKKTTKKCWTLLMHEVFSS